MLVENCYPSDTRVRKEAQSLKRFYDITVLSLKGTSEKYHEFVNGIEVIRIPRLTFPRCDIQNRSIRHLLDSMAYILQYFYFTVSSCAAFLGTFRKRHYSAVHAHNPPDTLFVVGIIAKCLSVKFIYDHHDLCPELYATRFHAGKNILYSTLLIFEKLSCKLSNIVLSTNQSYKAIVTDRHAIPDTHIHIVRNDPIESEFLNNYSQPKKSMVSADITKQILYVGSINPQDGVDVLMHIIQCLVYDLKYTDFACKIIGDGDSIHDVIMLARTLRIDKYVTFTGYVTDRRSIARELSISDVCVEPAPDNPLNRHSTFIKLMEYMAAGKPIVAFDLKESRYSCDGSCCFVEPEDIRGFAKAIRTLLEDSDLRAELGKVGRERIRNALCWENSESILIKAYESLFL